MDRNLALCFFLFSGLVIRESQANIGHFDEYWQEKAKNAEKAAHETYNPHPHNVTNDVNKQVGETLRGENDTRRHLGKYIGPCQATNPIDRCWRCRPDWEKNRKKLADCVLGFGHKTRGGQAGRFYVVTDSSDNDMNHPKPGTLRHAVIQEEPLWIIFEKSMVIRLNQELMMTSNKTIDCRGANVHIAAGAGITIQFVQNIIIHGLHVHDIVPGSGGMIRDSVNHLGLRTRSDGDGISIYGSSNVWIDHISMSNCADGLIDVIQGSTGVTISNGHFTHHNDVMLFGGSDSFSGDEKMQVTVAFNHFGKGLIQRMPRCRWGFVHVVNNDYTHWLMYAIGGSTHPTIISQGNRFIAPPHLPFSKEVTKRDYAAESVWKKWQWRSENDLMMNGAFFVQSGEPLKNCPFAGDLIKAEPGTSVTTITRFAGPLSCKPNKPC